MEWYHYVIIGVAAVLIIGALAFLFIYLSSKSKKNKRENEIKDYYLKIITAVGGKENIADVNNMSSRLSISLNDASKLDNALLQELVDQGIGMVKANKKITLVIGEKAGEFAKSIKEETTK